MHVGMGPSETSQTRWEWNHNTFTPSLCPVLFCLVFSSQCPSLYHITLLSVPSQKLLQFMSCPECGSIHSDRQLLWQFVASVPAQGVVHKSSLIPRLLPCMGRSLGTKLHKSLTYYRLKTRIPVINQLSAKQPMTRIRVMGTLSKCSDLLGTIYAINHIHCTYRKLNVHNGLQIDNVRAGSWRLWGVRLYCNGIV